MADVPVPPGYFEAPTLTVAKRLLGTRLIRKIQGQWLEGRIVEVEAYHQEGDAASHSYCGKTQRNAVMFGPKGHVYVYLSYGVHYCMNVVTEAPGIGAAVLIRAIQPLSGLKAIRQFRPKAKTDRDLANGPGKVCQAFAVGMAENGAGLGSPDLFLAEGPILDSETIGTSSRVGISKAVELPWRFFLAGNPFVSKGKPSALVATKKDGGA